MEDRPGNYARRSDRRFDERPWKTFRPALGTGACRSRVAAWRIVAARRSERLREDYASASRRRALSRHRGHGSGLGVDPRREPTTCRQGLTMVSHHSFLYERLTALEILRFWSQQLGAESSPPACSSCWPKSVWRSLRMSRWVGFRPGCANASPLCEPGSSRHGWCSGTSHSRHWTRRAGGCSPSGSQSFARAVSA